MFDFLFVGFVTGCRVSVGLGRKAGHSRFFTTFLRGVSMRARPSIFCPGGHVTAAELKSIAAAINNNNSTDALLVTGVVIILGMMHKLRDADLSALFRCICHDRNGGLE